MPGYFGFEGNGTTFNKEQVGNLESTGEHVTPTSFYEAQLALRLGKVPAWLEKLKLYLLIKKIIYEIYNPAKLFYRIHHFIVPYQQYGNIIL